MIYFNFIYIIEPPTNLEMMIISPKMGTWLAVLQNVELPNAELQNVENTKRRITKRR